MHHSLKKKGAWGHNLNYKIPKQTGNVNHNRFLPLHSLNEMETYSFEEATPVEVRERLLPLIVDAMHSFSAVHKLIGSAYKCLSIGTEIILESMAMYTQALNKLRAADLKFFTHQIKDEKKFKKSVKEVVTSKSSAEDALFILEFDKMHVSKLKIIKRRYFYGIRVHWRNPLKGNKELTQCFRATICTACSGPHNFSSSLVNKAP